MLFLRLWILLPFVVLIGCGGAAKKHFDDRTIAILSGATKVEVFRTDGYNDIATAKEKKPDEKRMGGYLVTAQGQDQGKEFAAKLSKILFDDRTYSNARAKCFWPGVAYRVWKDQECIDVLICFKCDNLYCGPPIERTFENASFWDSPLRSELVGLAKQAFPEDKQIQALTPNRE